MSRQLVKCPKCGWVHFVSSFEEMGQNGALSEEDKARLQRCFQCGAPSSDFVAARHGEAPMLTALQGVVLRANRRVSEPKDPENWQHYIDELSGGEFWIPREQAEATHRQQMKDRAIWPQFVEDLAHVCMCLKCIEADTDFRNEVAALVRDLTAAECQRAIEIVCADREMPDELKDMIEGYLLEARYDYLLDALTMRGIAHDDGQAASMHLAAGRPIYYADRRYPDGLVKRSPNGRKQLVSVDDQGVISVIRELP